MKVLEPAKGKVALGGKWLLACLFFTTLQNGWAQKVSISEAGLGWAGNSVNTVIFRKNSLTSYSDTQFIAYYNQQGYVVLGKRNFKDNTWQLKTTSFKGNIRDAHNSISIMADGKGYLHLAWDHHNHPLHYTRSIAPFSLEMETPMPMVGQQEQKVSYPEFYKLPNGNLLFFYRDGGSGNGNLVINQYGTANQTWSRLHTNLIDGEGKRNAYWQACVDAAGAVHISWVWRESPDVASNHDLCYAVSKNGGKTWQSSTGKPYALPINAATAEVVCAIPQRSELINQTSMCADDKGNAIIATYWQGSGGVPQYKIVYAQKGKWQVADLGFRTQGFSLSGGGTKKIPIARPQILCSGKGMRQQWHLVFRDEERGNKVSVASNSRRLGRPWKITDLYAANTGSWEPTFDTERWKNSRELCLFVQQVSQADGEGLTNSAPQPVKVVAYKF